MINILFVNNTSDNYGGSRILFDMIRTLDRARFTPFVVLPSEGALKPLLEEIGVKVFIDPGVCVVNRKLFNVAGLASLAARLPLSVLKFRALIRAHRIDVVHTNTAPILTPAFAAKLAGVPHIWHIRESFAEFPLVWAPFSRVMLGLSRRIISVSGPIARQFPKNDKVEVVFDGIDLDRYTVDQPRLAREFRDRFALGDDPIVGSIGRIKFVRKGQEFLVQAAALLKAKGVRARYVIVGTPFPGNEEHMERLRRLIDDLGLQSDVVLTGDLDDVRPAYSAMDLLVMTSALPEPMARVMTEAMAMERPVVATNLGGSPDAVEDGVTGFLIPPADPEALAAKIELLLADEAMRKRFGAAGRARIVSTFTLQAMADRFAAIYQAACPRPLPAPAPVEAAAGAP